MSSFDSGAFGKDTAFSSNAFDFGSGPSPPGVWVGPITGPSAEIGVGHDGGIFPITDAMPGHSQTGGVAFQFVMSEDWDGTITFVCRSACFDAWVADIDFVGPWPFHGFYLNGAGSTGAIVSGGSAAITDTSNVLVPTSGNFLAISVVCAAGTATMCYQPVSGSTTP